MSKLNKIYFLVVLVASTTFISCKKKEKEEVLPETPVAKTQGLTFNFSTEANGEPMEFGKTYTTNAGARYNLKSFRYYVSNIRLVRDDGSEYAISNKYLLVNPSQPDYDLGQVPVDSYIAVKFNVGVDSLTNHKDPTAYEENHPLAIQSPGIHWSWNSGYIFMMLEGSCDTTANNSDVLNVLGEYNHSLFFHIGTDKFYKEVKVARHFHVTEDRPYRLKIAADLDQLLDNIDIRTQNASHTFGSIPLATSVSNNIPLMFRVIP